MSTELFIPPTYAKISHIVNGINTDTGRFVKGHEPHNKGKSWNEYLTKRQQKRASKGWANLDKVRPKHRPDVEAYCAKKVVGVEDNGHFKVYKSCCSASRTLKASQGALSRCCRLNSNPQVNKKTGKLNTDHRYLGIRWYFESDDVWIHKIAL